MLRVKICGNREVREVDYAARHGADAVGLIIGARHHTEDELDCDTARILWEATPPFVTPVIVTHLLSAKEIVARHRRVPARVIQLHDAIPMQEIEALRDELPQVSLIKAVHVVDESAVDTARAYAPLVDALLVDSRTRVRIGGTGKTHDWSISRRVVEAVDKPVILAGGLTPANVQDAIETVRPYGVDVNSGVEFPDGRKSEEKVREFILRAKACSA